MNDDFLKALRHDPRPRFARQLKQKLQAQEAQSKRRTWSLRTLLFLIVGSAFASGMLVLERRHSENLAAASSPAKVATASPAPAGYRPRYLGPGFVPEGNGTASQGFSDSRPSAGSPANNVLSNQPRQTTQRAAGVVSSTPEQTTSGGLIGARAALSIAISPLADGLIRGVLNQQTYKKSATPRLRTMAESGAFSGFCAEGDDRQFDMVVSSRRIGYAEFMNCRRNGVNRIIESKLGYQALVLTTTADSVSLKLSASDVYLAVARQIPDPADLTRLINNTNFTWDQIDSKFAYRPITVFGPMRDTPLRLLFETLLLEPGCNAQRTIEPLKITAPDRYAELCHSLRDDRLYSEFEQPASLIPNLWSAPHGFVLVEYRSYLDNQAQLAGSALEGPDPSHATFADGSYPLARPIYVYVDETRMDRAVEIYDVLQDVRSFGLYVPIRTGFVRLDEREVDREPRRRKPPLTESDLNN